MDLKKIVHHLAHDLTGEITQAVSDIKKEIISIIETPEEKIIRFLKEKGIKEINHQTFSDSFGSRNIIANSQGEILTDNSTDLSRILLNIALFAEHGEVRLNKAMSGKASQALEKIEIPSRLIGFAKASQL